ncbi:hypothetical protein L6164_003998 [Bauhinia variegata]|uniref:Uncharacterized protein n=1 Tax=Bauhinia variegata TaxID=167791 RepID=A0ACB9Q524_BAUVA|nr:hypothetical protein L6164_003998 [Bauhinia variegata]
MTCRPGPIYETETTQLSHHLVHCVGTCVRNRGKQRREVTNDGEWQQEDESKVVLLKGLPHANERLVLFEADIYNPHEFEPAIQGCHYVFHVATPKQHLSRSQFSNITEAAVSGAKSIVMSCIKSGTVKRLIYTASVVSASPLKDGGSGFKDSIDETCWTPLDLSFQYNNDLHQKYTDSKTKTEKELLSYDNGGGLEVVTLACGLVGGETLLSSLPLSVQLFISPLKDNELAFYSVRFLEELLGKVPIVHIGDVCEAHIFCIEKPSISGRFLVASSYVSSADFANYCLQTYPDSRVKQKYLNGPKREIKWASTKLTDQEFVYKYDTKMIFDDCIRCATRLGHF